MRSSMRRVLALLMVFMMVFSSISFADYTPVDVEELSIDLTGMTFEKDFNGSKLSEDLRNSDLEAEDEVRVIVELQLTPMIEQATVQGVKFTDLSESSVTSMASAIEKEQNIVLEALNSEISTLEVHQKFDTVFNGFSVTMQYGDLEKLEKMDNVKSVSIANEYSRPQDMTPMMTNSSQLTKSAYANQALGYSGEGLVVAIIDTGIDFNHKDMQMDPTLVDEELTAKEVGLIVQTEGLPGKFFTAKVPYGYNYMDRDWEIRDLGAGASMHGMHVAGTVAANGEIKGVAPNAQVLAMKVFGNDPEFPSTFGDVIIAAIDDSIKLGADVMNLSLGSSAAFVDENDPEQQAITRATENGIVMAISAGNSAYYGYNSGQAFPYATNPDVGVVGSPGLVAESLQVASVDNYSTLYNNTVVVEGLDNPIMGYGKDGWAGSYELVAIGGDKLGSPDNYADLDVTGKIVLVSRGAYSFFDKTENAAAQGAAGIIVYDHGLAQFYKDQGAWAVPFMMISKADGLILEALLAEQPVVNFTATNEGYSNPASGQVSSFSSWGTTPDLSFKPDIAAPGGNIWSLANNNGYQYMSGTSMASPHAAGGAALVLERIKEDPIFNKLGLTEQQLVNFAKNILMNTAVPVQEEYGFASVRKQGAGSMDLEKALTTPAVVWEPNSGLAKVNGGEIKNNKLNFSLRIRNFGNETIAYDLGIYTQIQDAYKGYNLLSTDAMQGVGYQVTIGGEPVNGPIVLGPKAVKTVKFSYDFTYAVNYAGQTVKEIFPNGNFVESFVFFNQSEAYVAIAENAYNEAVEARDENLLLIETLTAELAQLELDLVTKQDEIDAKQIEVDEAQALVDANQVEIDTYVSENAAEVEDVLALIEKINAAKANLDTAMNAYNESKGNLISNAQDYSIATLFQGNYTFLSEIFNAIDDIDEGSVYPNPWAEAQRAELISKINHMISILNEYEAVVNTLTVEDFLGLSQVERAEKLNALTSKVQELQAELKFIDMILDMADFESYKTWIEEVKRPEIEARIANLEGKLANEQAKETPDEVKIAELQGKIQNTLDRKAKWNIELTKINKSVLFHSNVNQGINLNQVILDNTKDILEEAVIVDNAKAALSLLQATYDETDLTDYDAYLEGLSALEDAKLESEEAYNALIEALALLQAEYDQMMLDQETKNIAKEEAEALTEGFEAAVLPLYNALVEAGLVFDRTVDLSVPVMAFYGEWSDAPGFDAPRHNADSFYNVSGYIQAIGEDLYYMDPVSVFSPNDDGYKDIIIPYITLLRNMMNVNVQVVSESGDVLKTLAIRDAMRKHFVDGDGPKATFMEDALFDGTVNYEVLPDGNYFLRYTGQLATGEQQTQDIPLMIDTVAPVIVTNGYNYETGKFSISAYDELSGVENYYLLEPVFDENYDLVNLKVLESNDTGIFDISKLENPPMFVAYAVSDFGGNEALSPRLVQLVKGTVPAVTLNVEPFGIITEREFTLEGLVTDMLLDTVAVDGEEVNYEKLDNGNYAFTKEMAFEKDGKTGIFVEAEDILGNRLGFTRWFYIDSQAPVVELKSDENVVAPFEKIYLEQGTTSIDISVFTGDNFPSLTVKENDSVIYFEEHDFVAYEDEIQPIEFAYDKTIDLHPGLNYYVVSASDAAGTLTENVYMFYVLKDGETYPEATTLVINGPDKIVNKHNEGSKTSYSYELLDQYGDLFPQVGSPVWQIEVLENESVEENDVRNILVDDNGLVSINAYNFNITNDVKLDLQLDGFHVGKVVSVEVPSYFEGIRVPFEGDLFIYDFETDSFSISLEEDATLTLDIISEFYDQYDQLMKLDDTWTVSGNENVSINEEGKVVINNNAEGAFTMTPNAPEANHVSFVYNIIRLEPETPDVPSTPVTPPTVTPSPAPVVQTPKVTLNEDAIELEVGTEAEVSTFDLDATVTGTDQTTVVWSSSDDTIATVDANGLVTAVGTGTATITAALETGTAKATASVEVLLVGDEVTPLGDVTFNQPYMSGYPDGTFKPEGTITRAELAVVFSKILGLNVETTMGQKFGDVDASHWAYNYVNAVARAGIFSGYEDGTFRPDQEITRGELAATFSKFWSFQNIEVKADPVAQLTDSANHWAAAHIFRLFNAQVLDQSLTAYAPDAPALRGQVVLMINKLIGRDALEVETSKFKDVNDMTLIGAIEAATQTTVKLND
ncbi:MAG: S8 family serine peptidase [Clostridia bacterium]|nr:S8 family serine peptidase [Clostridia bacterium]